MSRHPTTPPLVLTFAGSDPTCGAGLQADLMTIASLGCHPLTVITAVTVQDSARVTGVDAIDAGWLEDQARQVLEDVSVSAFKVGLIGSVENVAAIAEVVADYPDIPLVLDPVLAAGNGDDLAGDEIVSAMRELLIPQTTVLTPNSLEARRLAAADLGSDDGSLEECAMHMLGLGCEFVLVTGTHENTMQVVNSLYGPVRGPADDDGDDPRPQAMGLVRSDAWTRLAGSYHGSGCTLAAAIAAMLANGQDVPQAVREAQEYTWNTLKAAFRPGMGQFIPDRFFWARRARED
ncbi:MAG: hydroxymethylpyrimidine/phosphomethylpyrimidine kinase [Burkholderiales bacterium]|nr:hydroxymethylpyrimidine/phosphomethylpyrimidine kinase [Burkholderiales bacterium]